MRAVICSDTNPTKNTITAALSSSMLMLVNLPLSWNVHPYQARPPNANVEAPARAAPGGLAGDADNMLDREAEVADVPRRTRPQSSSNLSL